MLFSLPYYFQALATQAISTETPLSTYSQIENSVYGKCTYVKTSIPK